MRVRPTWAWLRGGSAGLAAALMLMGAPTSTATAAPEARLVADVYPGLDGSSPEMRGAARLGGHLYFGADDGVHGRELWRTDGSTTELVADIRPGADSSNVDHLLAFAGHIYFAADEGVHGYELWRTDGATTELVADIRPGAFGSGPLGFTRLGSALVFSAGTSDGRELYRTDGTTTAQIADIHPGAGASNPYPFSAFGGYVYFAANDGVHGVELWRTDGVTASLWADIEPGAAGSGPQWFTTFKGALYFSAATTLFGREPWRTDGVTTGLVANINGASGAGSDPAEWTRLGNQLFFRAEAQQEGAELWRTDGGWPIASTTMAKDVAPGAFDSYPRELTVYGGRLYFDAFDGVHGRELWRTDGATTELAADINPGSGGSSPYEVTAFAGALHFSADLPATGRELWVFDGAGASLFADLRPGAGSSEPEGFSALNGALYFSADDGVHGFEPWRVAPAAVPDGPLGPAGSPGPPGQRAPVEPSPRRPASIFPFRMPQRLDQRRVARVARLSCPEGALCRAAARKRVRVRIGKRRYKLRVIAPKTVRGGKHQTVGVRFSKAAAKRLRNHTTTLRLSITLGNDGDQTRRNVKVKVTGKPQRLSRRRTARVARLWCPDGPVCRVAVSKRVTVRIGKRHHRLRVLAPKTLSGGARSSVRVRFSKAAARHLRGHTTTLKLEVTLVIDQDDKTTRRVQVRIIGKHARKART